MDIGTGGSGSGFRGTGWPPPSTADGRCVCLCVSPLALQLPLTRSTSRPTTSWRGAWARRSCGDGGRSPPAPKPLTAARASGPPLSARGGPPGPPSTGTEQCVCGGDPGQPLRSPGWGGAPTTVPGSQSVLYVSVNIFLFIYPRPPSASSSLVLAAGWAAGTVAGRLCASPPPPNSPPRTWGACEVMGGGWGPPPPPSPPRTVQ